MSGMEGDCDKDEDKKIKLLWFWTDQCGGIKHVVWIKKGRNSSIHYVWQNLIEDIFMKSAWHFEWQKRMSENGFFE